ncbi:MAG: hypothetical protein HYZ20_14500 [Burkholderiales bacterium]|nr:hypothetical protein [Burkholderiales bacterium]
MVSALIAAALVAACGGGSGRYEGTDLRVSGVGPAAAVAGGSEVVFEMTVTNAGDAEATELSITNEIAGAMTLLEIGCSAEAGAVCPDPPSESMQVASLRAGGVLRFTVAARVDDGARGTLSNRMSVQSSTAETDATNNSARVTATTQSSNLVVSGSGPAGNVAGGAGLDFLMQVRNEGPDPATGVRVVNDVGSGVILAGISCAASGGAVCPAEPSASMEIGDMPVGGVLDFAVTGTVAANLNGIVTNTMQATADADGERADNSFTAQASVVTPLAGVFVTGVGPADALAGGATATFAMSVGNAGPDPAVDLTILDDVGAGLLLTAVRCSADAGATCPEVLGPLMEVPTLPVGGTLLFEVDAVVAAGATGLLTNTMSARAANDPTAGDNSATAVVTAQTPRAMLSLSGSGPADTVSGGTQTRFEMTVLNTGPDAATGIEVRQNVGSNLSFMGATCAADGGAVCPASVGVISAVDSLPVGGSLSFQVEAFVAVGTNGAISNTMQVVGDNLAGGAGNSVVAVGTAFSARSSLELAGTAPAMAVPSGEAALFDVTLSNSGPDPAADVRLLHIASGNLTVTGVRCIAASGGAACPATVGIVTDIASLPVGGVLGFEIATTVAPASQGAIVMTTTASVVAGGMRSETVAVTVGSAYAVDVSVAASGPEGPLAGGDGGEFLMEVRNAGPADALDLVLVDTLSAGLQASGPIVCQQALGGAICPAIAGTEFAVPLLPVGASLRFSVPFTVATGTSGVVGNTMTATVAGELRPADNSATASFRASP